MVSRRILCSINWNSANNGFSGKREQISCFDLNQLSIFVINNYFNIRAIFKQHLPAVSARRDNAIQMFFMNSNDCVKFPFSI